MPKSPQSKTETYSSLPLIAGRVLKIKQVCDLTGLSRASVYRLAAINLFPSPIKIGIKASGWRLYDLENWLAARPAVKGGM
jgi:prophage regulatory protein